MENNIEYTEFRKALNEIYSTPQGKLVLEGLEQWYVDINIFNPDTNTTMYNLGKKELIQSLIAEAKLKYEPVQPETEG